jgi:hypothetical protein
MACSVAVFGSGAVVTSVVLAEVVLRAVLAGLRAVVVRALAGLRGVVVRALAVRALAGFVVRALAGFVVRALAGFDADVALAVAGLRAVVLRAGPSVDGGACEALAAGAWAAVVVSEVAAIS